MPFTFLELSRWPIRWKLAAILSVVVVLNIVTDLLVQKLVILPSFERLEQDEAREASDRCVKVISQEAKHLRLFAEDWSSWDDTYQFAVDGGAAYIASNLTAAMFRSAQLNLVCVFNVRGEVVWGGVRHEGSDGAITKDAVLERELAETPAILRQDSSLSAVSGIFLSRRGPLVVASMPILTNDGRGPSRGAFVMGRVLDDAMITSLGDQAGVTLRVWPIRRGALPRDKAAVLERITPANPSVVQVKDDKSIGVFTVYRDVARAPGLLLESVIERDITPKGKSAGKYALLSSAVSGLVILLALIFSLRNAVVAPIRNLTRRVMDFSAGDSRLRSNLDEHGDEVALLSKEFGEMKERLEADMEQRRLSEARMRAILVSAPDGILTVDQSGAIESLNPAGEAMFGYSAGELAGKNWRVLVSGEFRDADDRQVATAIRERAAAGTILGHEVAGVRKDGSVFPMHVTASEVQLGGRRVILGILRDITELTQMH
ncbi:MAG: PAS domain S-box protein [Candidatus Hydrogenedentes bacterium]|nr:PAS domain S-box protein [Candidatus Hydrogenedentota bacterium]